MNVTNVLLLLILGGLSLLIYRSFKMGAALERLKTEVAETKTVAESAVALIGGLAQQIRDAIEDEDALNELADSLDADQAELSAAITANTPASPEPEPTPEPPVEEPAPAPTDENAADEEDGA